MCLRVDLGVSCTDPCRSSPHPRAALSIPAFVSHLCAQLGLTFCDAEGRLPVRDNYFCAWQFNFREFNIAEDMYAQARNQAGRERSGALPPAMPRLRGRLFLPPVSDCVTPLSPPLCVPAHRHCPHPTFRATVFLRRVFTAWALMEQPALALPRTRLSC